jgi:hypothetical protein
MMQIRDSSDTNRPVANNWARKKATFRFCSLNFTLLELDCGSHRIKLVKEAKSAYASFVSLFPDAVEAMHSVRGYVELSD